MVISTGLKILYSFLYREYINHIAFFFNMLTSHKTLERGEEKASLMVGLHNISLF
jgi:hypothetical protein